MMTGGDLAGIRQRLPYLRDLGINALYTTPLFVSPSNHKYDTTDYYRIDPAFGSNAEFARLVQEARRMGIRFILDGVFNHSGREWFAFQDVVKHGRKSAYRDWFYDLHSLPPDPSRINYETFSNGISTMPKLDTSHPRCAAYFLDVAEYWIKTADIDGWRLDVANEVDHRFWRAFRQRVKSLKPDAFLLGELMHEATDWLQGDQFDSSMNYPWRDATLAFLQCRMDAREYDQELTRLRFAQTAEANRGLLNLLGSHDTPRIRTEVGSAERAGLAAVLLLTASGVPLIYYGDEIGMEGGPDPDCRRCYPWDKPKQQRADLLALYRRLIQIRRACPWLNDGAWQTLLADPLHSVYVYRRLSAPPESPRRPDREDRLTIVLNNTGRTQEISLPLEGETTNLLCDCMNAGRVIAPDRLALPPLGLSILASESLAKSILR
jgi:glycosidase